jgi:condensin complex subunit 3
MIRVQVVIALSKLAGSENANELDEGEKTVLDILLDTLVSDPSPYVLHFSQCPLPLTGLFPEKSAEPRCSISL